MLLKLKRTPGIYLVGFMACGKTTIGKLLAEDLGWTFVDLDEDIEAVQGVSIAHIFDTKGEAEFRRIEAEAVRRCVGNVERGRPTVAALGGGAFAQPANFVLLQDNGVTVWLDCPFDIVQRRVGPSSHRPLARDPVRFRQLYQARREAYVRADFRIPITDDDGPSYVGAILKLPVF